MPTSSFPFDGQTTTEYQYSKLMREAAPTGVADGGGPAGTDLAVTGMGTGMNVRLSPGTAVVRGHAYVNDSALTVPISASDTVTRIDVVVLRLDPASNSIVEAVVKGTPGSGEPPLTQTDSGVYEFPIANVAVAANVVTITGTAVTDRRRFGNSWTTAGRPTNPRKGDMGFNVQTNTLEVWNGTVWRFVAGDVPTTFVYRRPTTPADNVSFWSSSAGYVTLFTCAVPTTAPLGRYRVSVQLPLVSSGPSPAIGYLRVLASAGGTGENLSKDCRADAVTVALGQSFDFVFTKSTAAAYTVTVAHRCASTGVSMGLVDLSSSVTIQYVGA